MNIKEIAQQAMKLTIPEWMKVDIKGNYQDLLPLQQYYPVQEGE